jgi:hypothetical protein
MSPQRRIAGKVIGCVCAGAVLLTPVKTGTQAPPQAAAGRAGQAARVQIPAEGQIMVRRPRPGQITQLVISVANGGLVDGQSEPTEAGKGMISRFVGALREADTLESYVFLVRSYSSPRTGAANTGERGQRGATAAAATRTTTSTARTSAAAGVAAGRGAAQAATPQVLQRAQVQTVRGLVQTGRAAAIRRQLVDVERVATDRVRVYAHGEARPEQPEADAPAGDYV